MPRAKKAATLKEVIAAKKPAPVTRKKRASTTADMPQPWSKDEPNTKVAAALHVIAASKPEKATKPAAENVRQIGRVFQVGAIAAQEKARTAAHVRKNTSVPGAAAPTKIKKGHKPTLDDVIGLLAHHGIRFTEE